MIAAALDAKQLRADNRDRHRIVTHYHARSTASGVRRVFRPVDGAEPKYELTIPIQFDRVLIAAVPSFARVGMASPSGTTPFSTRDPSRLKGRAVRVVAAVDVKRSVAT